VFLPLLDPGDSTTGLQKTWGMPILATLCVTAGCMANRRIGVQTHFCPRALQELTAAPGTRSAGGAPHERAASTSEQGEWAAGGGTTTAREATALDRVHTAILLRKSSHTNALRALHTAEQERGPDFLRLANALSALYPCGSKERRLLDAMLPAVPR
jgi:hypothetical protein